MPAPQGLQQSKIRSASIPWYSADVLFLDRSEELQSIRCEIPVHLEEEAPGMTACMQVFAHVVCEQIQAVTKGDGLDIRVMLPGKQNANKNRRLSLVCGIELEEESEKRPAGIIIYFVGMGEDLMDDSQTVPRADGGYSL